MRTDTNFNRVSSVRPLRVLFNLCGDRNKASSRVRGFWITQELERLGHLCTIHISRKKLDFARCAQLISQHDVVVFQKTYSRYDVMLIRLAKALNRQTYFDIDDAPSRTMNPRTLKNAASMMRLADGVLAGCANLAQLAKTHGARVHLLPSGIRVADYTPRRPGSGFDRVCLGWIGNGAHYADDLIGILRGPVEKVAARYPPLRLKIVGACGERRLYDAFASIPGLEVAFIDAIEWSQPMAVSKAISEFDIGVYPLIDSDFNRFKCGFKALEYMATGVPVVASNVAPLGDIVSDGVDGYVVEDVQEWTERLGRLIEDATLREHFGRAGRQKIEAEFSTEQLAVKLLDIFGRAQPTAAASRERRTRSGST